MQKGIIKEIHKAVIEDNLALLKKLNRDPVPVELFASKDKNGLTPLHKVGFNFKFKSFRK